MRRSRTGPALRVTDQIPQTVKRLSVPLDIILSVLDLVQVFTCTLPSDKSLMSTYPPKRSVIRVNNTLHRPSSWLVGIIYIYIALKNASIYRIYSLITYLLLLI